MAKVSLIGWAALLGVLPALPLAAAPAPAAADYGHAPEMKALLHWPHMPVRVGFVDDSADTPGREKDALAGFSEWVAATGGAVRFQIVGDPRRADIVVGFNLEPYVPGHPGAVGHTELTHDGPVMVKADMTLATAGVPSDEMVETAAHEFGHALGLNGHSDAPADMMYPSTTRVLLPDGTLLPTLPRMVTSRDLSTLWLCYPALRPGAALPASSVIVTIRQPVSIKNHKKQ